MKKIIIFLLLVVLMLTPANTENVNAKSKGTEHLKVINRKPEIRLLAGILDTNRSEYKSISQAANAVRGKVTGHNPNVSVYIRTTIDNPEEVYSKFRAELTKETSNSSEGDYMYWDFKSESPSYVYVPVTDSGKTYYYYYFNITYRYYTTLEQKRQVDYRVKEIINSLGFNEETTDYQKVKMIYDYVCKNVDYAKDVNRDIVYTSWAALFEGEAVCQGYAQLMYKMLKEVGIQVRLIPGFGMNEMHGWNIVKLGDYYYNIDATWDSQNIHRGLHYKFFLKGDKFPLHTRMSEYSSNKFYSSYPMATYDYGTSILKPSIKSRKAAFKIIKPKFKKVNRRNIKIKRVSGASKYEIIYAADSRFKKNKKIIKTKKVNVRIKKLNKKSKYYIKFRALCYINGTKVYTKWSSKNKISIKK